jgi:hypothetical protein
LHGRTEYPIAVEWEDVLVAGLLLQDWRTGKNAQHTMVGRLRQSVFGRQAGYEDWRSVLESIVDRYRRADIDRSFRGEEFACQSFRARHNPGNC